MKKRNGFAFIETVITVVVLSASLLYIYNSYNAIIKDEETKLYYDDISYIYKTNYIRRFFDESSNIEWIKKNGFEDKYIITLGNGYEGMFNSVQMTNKMNESLEKIVTSYHINQILLIKSKMFDDCISESDLCKNEMDKLTYNMRSYVNTLNDTSYDYYLVIEYAEKMSVVDGEKVPVKCTPGTDINCNSFYASLGM